MARLRAGMPPRSSCSATGSCSGRKVASAAFRCSVDCGSDRVRPPRSGGAPRFGPGRGPREESAFLRASLLGGPVSGRSPRGPAGRAAVAAGCSPLSVGLSLRRGRGGESGRLSGLSPRGAPLFFGGRSSKSPPPRLFPSGEASDTDTVLCWVGVPRISMRSPSRPPRPADFGPMIDVTSIPSRSNSASARRTIPGVASAGSRSPSTTPRGWRAPGARQVHVPSARLLVSSISILRPMPIDHASNEVVADFLEGFQSPGSRA
jgi:hypothetical protein